MANNNFTKPSSKSGSRFSPPSDTKTTTSSDSYKPIFSFTYMRYGSNTCLSKCDKKTQSSLAKKLLQLSQLTWSEILSISKKSFGCERIPYDQLKNRLPATITPDTIITVFRLSDSARMIGFRRHNVYHIVQVSPNHDLY
jgi:hypothetical protein